MIDLRLEEDQQLIRETVQDFAMEKMRPAAHDADESWVIPASLVAQAWERGLVQGSVPEEYGGYGQGSSAVTGTVIAEAMAEGDLAVAMHVLSPRLVIDPVLLLGSEAQKKEVLPRYCGEQFVAGSAAVCEQRWDFSPGKMQTTARRDGAGWVLEGKKCLVQLERTKNDDPIVAQMLNEAIAKEGAMRAMYPLPQGRIAYSPQYPVWDRGATEVESEVNSVRL